MRLASYVNGKVPLLLRGRNGMSMLADALELSKALLNTDNLEVHPDFLLISTDKKTIGVELAQKIVEKASQRPMVAEKRVCVIDGMDKMTVQAQNKILLSLESSPNMQFIGISYGHGVIDTILSRMQLVPYQHLLLDEFIKTYTEKGYTTEDAELFFQAGDGAVSMQSLFDENKDMLHEVRNNVLSDKRHLLLKTLHLLRENDAEAVTNDSELMKAVLRIIARACCDKAMELCVKERGLSVRFARICNEIDDDVLNVDKSSYTKNNFFETVIKVIEI